MTWINKMKAENRQLKEDIANIEEQVREIWLYANSQKFMGKNTTINKNDIILRTRETLNFISDLQLAIS